VLTQLDWHIKQQNKHSLHLKESVGIAATQAIYYYRNLVGQIKHVAIFIRSVYRPQGALGPTPGAHACLPHSLQPSLLAGVLGRPVHVHRLDAPTGGLLVVAKTSRVLTELGAAFAERWAQP